jgi:hypothetical protein
MIRIGVQIEGRGSRRGGDQGIGPQWAGVVLPPTCRSLLLYMLRVQILVLPLYTIEF